MLNFLRKIHININKREFIIVIILLMLSFITFSWFNFKDAGTKVIIDISQVTYGVYQLDQDQIISIIDDDDHLMMKAIIENNSISVIYTDCPDKICQKSGQISMIGEKIVCLPNKIVISIFGDTGNENSIDGVLQ